MTAESSRSHTCGLGPGADAGGLRIAWVIQGDERYGVARAIESLFTAVSRRGHKPFLICMGGGAFAERMADRGVEVVGLGIGPVPNLAGSPLRKMIKLRRLLVYSRRARHKLITVLKDREAQAVHFLWPTFVSVVGPAASGLGLPSFWEMPNAVGDSVPLGLNRRWYQRQCRHHDVTVLANSAYTASTLGPGPVQPFVMHLGVDPEVFNPERVDSLSRASLGLPEGAVVLIVVARLSPSKGQDRVLKAMLKLVAEGHDLHLLLLGGPADGDFARGLRAQATAASQPHRLHLAGQVAEPERYYGAVDIGINLRVDPEPYGLSVVEAMMMGVPMLVHALGGPAETVVDGETGWHIDKPTIAAIEKSLHRVLADRTRWVNMGRAARMRAVTHFTLERQVDHYLKILLTRLNVTVFSATSASDYPSPGQEPAAGDGISS